MPTTLNAPLSGVQPSELTAGTTLAGTDVVPVGQSGGLVRTTLNAIATFVKSTYNPASGGSQPQAGGYNLDAYYDAADGTNWTPALTAAIAAAPKGYPIFYPTRAGGRGILAPFQVKERCKLYSFQTGFYDSDDTEALDNALYALPGFAGTAMYRHADTSVGRGAQFENIMMVGLGDGASAQLNAFDFGPPGSGGERSVKIKGSQFMGFSGAVLCGHMWVVETEGCFVSRVGNFVRPVSGGGTNGAPNASSQALDCKFGGFGYVYYSYHHAFDFSGSAQHGQIQISNLRVERTGSTPLTSEDYRDQAASAIYATRLSVLGITNMSTDANSGPDIKFVGAVDEGSVNNVTASDLQLKRGGQGNLVDTDLPAVWLDRCKAVSLRGLITFGKPGDSSGGTTRNSPQHGVWMNRAYYSTWDGTSEIGSGNTQATLYAKMPAASTVSGTQEDNFRSYVRDARYNAWQPILMGSV